MTDPVLPKLTYVLQVTTTFTSFDEAAQQAPEQIAAHIARSKDIHAGGDLLMAGAFLDDDGGPLRTMAVLTTREAAEEYAKGDPFVLAGMVAEWRVREWANMLA